ncbi:hypothetical protein RYH73_15380 [Olivibacter sp. CPCC 100613]|uniref:hypothetical protein n=1 Tax=Olivibacter sp. CPCC 100613 TaxID=3079931 RepID=UPI002FF693AB
MLIYRGWGVLALLIPILCVIVDIAFFGEAGNSTLRGFLYSLLVSGILIVPLGLYLKRRGRKHDLYFIPLFFWGIVWIVVALGFLFAKGLL